MMAEIRPRIAMTSRPAQARNAPPHGGLPLLLLQEQCGEGGLTTVEVPPLYLRASAIMVVWAIAV